MSSTVGRPFPMGLGENLIFLISQPRAGSTLLQRILGSHSDVHTVSEPWLMLYPLYALRSQGYRAEYGECAGRQATQDFLEALHGGEEQYFEGVRRMYAYLYEQALVNSGRRYFLDKTPRYYLVIPELYRTFPKAQFIVLLRNPLAILCSLINSWVRSGWFLLGNFKLDLIRAPFLVLDGIELLGEQALVIHYEQLVHDPDSEIRELCNKLGITFAPQMIDYGSHKLKHWRLGDSAVYQHLRPVEQNASKWQEALTRPQVWRLVNDYLQLLGQDVIEKMGYSYEELCQVMDVCRPFRLRSWFTFSLTRLLRKPFEERTWWVRAISLLINSMQRQGISHTLRTIGRKITHVPSNSE